jgi:hypothetical protein
MLRDVGSEAFVSGELGVGNRYTRKADAVATTTSAPPSDHTIC